MSLNKKQHLIFSQRLRSAINFNHLSLKEVAAKCNIWSVWLAHFLNPDDKEYIAPTLDHVLALSKVLDVTPNFLLGFNSRSSHCESFLRKEAQLRKYRAPLSKTKGYKNGQPKCLLPLPH